MKFIHYQVQEEKKLGILKDDQTIVDLKNWFTECNREASTELNDLIEAWDDGQLDSLQTYVKQQTSTIDLDAVKVLAPIEYPKRNIFCLGKNYLDHAMETTGLPGSDDDIPKFPIYFGKIANPAIGHGDTVLNHKSITEMVDYEVELAIVIGKDGIDIDPEAAEEHIFGYTIVNDISARNIQRKHGQWFKGKCLETFCPMGPVLVHKTAMPFPIELDIKCSINGELRQNSNTRQLIFDIPYIISDLSKGMYLRKGDIIITGTPAGVGLGFTPYKFLKSGDRMDCEIEKIGTLTNFFE